MSDFSQYDNIIDSRHIQERIEELYDELDLDDSGQPNEYDEGDEKPEPLPDDERAELEEELRELAQLKTDVESCSGDRFEDGITLIADSYFEDYAQKLAEDMYGEVIRHAAWPFDNIDWEGAASDLKTDYTQVSWNGYYFWVR